MGCRLFAQSTTRQVVVSAGLAWAALLIFGCQAGKEEDFVVGTPEAAESVGERLFLETRFAQAFKAFLDSGGTVNEPPPAGDPVLDDTQTIDQPLPGPFAGLTMNCRTCHLVDEHVSTPGGGMRTYADFARRSPLPERPDSKLTTVRNSPPLVNASLDRPGGLLLHFDAEFATLEDLIAATFTGRNFGWLPGQKTEAMHHIATVVRGDNGKGSLAQQFDGQPYRILFMGTDPAIPEEFRLTSDFRVVVDSDTDQRIFDAVVKAVAAYVNSLRFSKQDDNGHPIRSPFDIFLQLNGLPAQPAADESPLDYSRRLMQIVQTREQNGTLQFVTANPNTSDGKFQFHAQEFIFGVSELQGLKIFLTEPPTLPPAATVVAPGSIGNCLACHPAPHFTDFQLHNTGVTQREYDAVHGGGQFAQLVIPTLAQRSANPQAFLPATDAHPSYQEPFRAIPSVDNPLLADLGVWNIFANPDFPAPQAKIRAILCAEHGPQACPDDSTLLDETIARFKTPSLRDLGHSAPYMHNGQFDTLEAVIRFYIGVAAQARQGTLRNGAAALQGIVLTEADIVPLVAFLKSLNEDYQ
jgi:cytochrome c peroxidase